MELSITLSNETLVAGLGQKRLNRQPPSAGRVIPVTMSKAGLHIRVTMPATSERVTRRPAGGVVELGGAVCRHR